MSATLSNSLKPSFIMPASVLATACEGTLAYLALPSQPDTARANHQAGFINQPNIWRKHPKN